MWKHPWTYKHHSLPNSPCKPGPRQTCNHLLLRRPQRAFCALGLCSGWQAVPSLLPTESPPPAEVQRKASCSTASSRIGCFSLICFPPNSHNTLCILHTYQILGKWVNLSNNAHVYYRETKRRSERLRNFSPGCYYRKKWINLTWRGCIVVDWPRCMLSNQLARNSNPCLASVCLVGSYGTEPLSVSVKLVHLFRKSLKVTCRVPTRPSRDRLEFTKGWIPFPALLIFCVQPTNQRWPAIPRIAAECLPQKLSYRTNSLLIFLKIKSNGKISVFGTNRVWNSNFKVSMWKHSFKTVRTEVSARSRVIKVTETRPRGEPVPLPRLPVPCRLICLHRKIFFSNY